MKKDYAALEILDPQPSSKQPSTSIRKYPSPKSISSSKKTNSHSPTKSSQKKMMMTMTTPPPLSETLVTAVTYLLSLGPSTPMISLMPPALGHKPHTSGTGSPPMAYCPGPTKMQTLPTAPFPSTLLPYPASSTAKQVARDYMASDTCPRSPSNISHRNFSPTPNPNTSLIIQWCLHISTTPRTPAPCAYRPAIFTK